MRMPADFVDDINKAVEAVDPDAGTMTSGSFTLGSDFDEFFGPEAMLKYGLGPVPADVQAKFEKLFAEKREAIKASIIANSVERAKQRFAERSATP